MKPPIIPPLRPEPARDPYGRYLLADPASGARRPYTRATTVAHTLDDTSALTRWKRRMVLQGAAADPTLLDNVTSLAVALKHSDGQEARDLKAALDDICDAAARKAGAEDGAGWGTALHAVTEYLDTGRLHEIEVPPDLLADIAAYDRTLTEARIRRPAEHVERIVVNTTVEAAGTYDRLLQLPDGRLVVGDLKTQQIIYDWLGIAIQLAQYAHADGVLGTDVHEWEPLPDNLDISTGIVIHLPARSGQCRLYEVDLDAGWEAAQLAHRVRQLRGRARTLGRPWTPPAPAEHTQLALDVDALLTAIRLAPNTGTLVRLWRQHQHQWTDQHTGAAAHRKQQLQNPTPFTGRAA